MRTISILLLSILFGCTSKHLGETLESSSDVRMYLNEVTHAANELIELIPANKRDSLVIPFNSTHRFEGIKNKKTPSFCAVVAWCSNGWGIQLGQMSHEQLVASHKLLNTALSPGGYQILLTVMNHQRIIGEMEQHSETKTVKDAIAKNPDQHVNSVFDLKSNIPDSLFYPTIAGAGHPTDSGTKVNWLWKPPGIKLRWEQFNRYSLALFGVPGSKEGWGIRFEGHHISINLVFVPDKESGEIQVYTTPLFFGSFPMIIPDSPYNNEDSSPQWNWEKGQLMMFSVAHHLHQFWLAVPDDLRKKAYISADSFPQSSPLILDTPIPSMISSLDTIVDPSSIEKYPFIKVNSNNLSPDALWHLKQAYLFYISSMNLNISNPYLERIDKALSSSQEITLSWAGSTALENDGNRHYTYVVVDSLLLEFLQSNQFVVQHNPEVSGNHLHSMLRDLSFDWTVQCALII